MSCRDDFFSGRGLVCKTMLLTVVEYFNIGGVAYFIMIHQSGFFIKPNNSRSALYSSYFGKAFDIHILHCSGDGDGDGDIKFTAYDAPKIAVELLSSRE